MRGNTEFDYLLINHNWLQMFPKTIDKNRTKKNKNRTKKNKKELKHFRKILNFLRLLFYIYHSFLVNFIFNVKFL